MKRILTAAVLILAVFALIFFGNLWMITLFSAIVAELAAYEYLKLASVGAEAHNATLRIPIWVDGPRHRPRLRRHLAQFPRRSAASCP